MRSWPDATVPASAVPAAELTPRLTLHDVTLALSPLLIYTSWNCPPSVPRGRGTQEGLEVRTVCRTHHQEAVQTLLCSERLSPLFLSGESRGYPTWQGQPIPTFFSVFLESRQRSFLSTVTTAAFPPQGFLLLMNKPGRSPMALPRNG